jgi:hypothetical protein
MSNYKFYSKKLSDYNVEFPAKLQFALDNIGRELIDKEPDSVFFVKSTPSLAIVKDELVVNVRYVNYRINDRGGYENQDFISTKNVIARFDMNTWEKKTEDFMWYDVEKDNLYVGLEDVRMFYSESQNRLLYNANRGLGAHNLKVEHGNVLLREEVSASPEENKPESGIVTMDGQRDVEKNWVMFEDANGNLKMVYNWHDMVVGNCVPVESGYEFRRTHTIKTPPVFKYFRGSTNGVRIGDEIWFICHVVSYEDRRYYYHSIFTIDATTYEVRRFTPLFTFDGDKVEYTLGFVYLEDEQELQKESGVDGTTFTFSDSSSSDGTFWIGYSKMDCSTHYMAVKKSAIEKLMT